jgi:hypothetical protein
MIRRTYPLVEKILVLSTYSEYREDLHRRLGTAADQPHRLKYKTLKR